MTTSEITEFVEGELSELNLSTKEKERIITYMKKLDFHYQKYKTRDIDVTEAFLSKLEDCGEFFKSQGFDDETSLIFTKKAIVSYDYKDFKQKLAFLRIINFEESAIMNDSLCLRFNLEKAHAKKLYLVTINNKSSQNRNAIIKNDLSFEKKFNIQIKDLLRKQPLTKETIDIWMTISNMDDKKFQSYFGITRNELSDIYPTTKDELATIHFISTLSNDEIIKRYGTTRQELLKKYPLNNDTLKALKSINSTKQQIVEKLFGQPKEDVLRLRTITTEMIKLANQRKLTLQTTSVTKEDTKTETIKSKKKGTHPNG